MYQIAAGLTSHHGHQAGLVDVGEGPQLSDSQDGLHVGVATGLPKLTDLIVHGCRERKETLINIIHPSEQRGNLEKL